MNGPLAPVPPDDFVLPVPTSHSEDSRIGRRSVDSSWSQISRNLSAKPPPPDRKPSRGVWRHTIGIILLLATVLLWTASNFLASVGFTGGEQLAVCTDRLTCRLSLQTTATPNHTLSHMSIHPSSLSCYYWLLQGGCGLAVDMYRVLFVDMIDPPTICLSLNPKSKHLLSLTMKETFKKRAGYHVAVY